MTAPAGTAPPTHPPFGRRDHLDGLRTVAVYLVVLFHAGATRFEGGYIGVDLFFVLSGYLVTHVILTDLWGPTGRLSLRTFYARRVRRLLPAAVVTLVATAVLYSMVASPAEARASVDSFLAAFLYVSNWHFIREASDYFAADVSTNPVLHFWSLSIEEQFYFVWPPLLIGLAALRRRVPRGDLVVRLIVLATALASAAWALHLSQSNMSRAYYGSDSRAYQLLAGALLAMSPRLAEMPGSPSAPRSSSDLGWPRSSAPARWPASSCSRRKVTVPPFGSCRATAHLWYSSHRVVPGSTCQVFRNLFTGEVTAEHPPLTVLLLTRAHLRTAPTCGAGRLIDGAPRHRAPRQPPHPRRSAAGAARGGAERRAAVRDLPIAPRPPARSRATIAIGGGGAASSWASPLIPPLLETETSGTTTVARSEGSASTGSGDIETVDWQAASEDKGKASDCIDKPVSACAVGPQTGARVLLIGDSHGVMLRPAMEEIAQRRGYALSVAAVNGCSWHLGLTWAGATPEVQQRCFDVQRDWYDRIIAEVDPELVVVIQRAIDDPDRKMEFVGDGPELQGLSQAELVERTANASLAAFRRAGVPVAIVESIPVTGEDKNPLTCLSTADRLEQCRYVAQLGVTPVERIYRSAGSGISSVNIDSLVCPYLPICDPVIDDVVVKWDATHMTATFARAISADIERALDDAGVLP